MRRLADVFLMLALATPTAAGIPYSETIAGTTGMSLCCRPAYWDCYQRCPMKRDRTEGGCLAGCEAKHCVARTSDCPKRPGEKEKASQERPSPNPNPETSSQAPTPPPKPPGPAAQMRNDGRLTGPGTVMFEAANLATNSRTLSLAGIIFGQKGAAIRVLKQTEVYAVIPSHPTKFTLQVTPSEYQAWSAEYGELTIAFTLAEESQRDRWRYENRLTEADVQAARHGEFQVKGAFAPLGSPGK